MALVLHSSVVLKSLFEFPEYPTTNKRNYSFSGVGRDVCFMDPDIFWFNCVLRIFIGIVKDYFITQKTPKLIIYISRVSLYPPQF